MKRWGNKQPGRIEQLGARVESLEKKMAELERQLTERPETNTVTLTIGTNVLARVTLKDLANVTWDA